MKKKINNKEMKYNNNKLEEDLKHSILQILPQELPLPEAQQLFKKDELSYGIGWNSCIIEVKRRLGLYPDTLGGITETLTSNSAQLSAISPTSKN